MAAVAVHRRAGRRRVVRRMRRDLRDGRRHREVLPLRVPAEPERLPRLPEVRRLARRLLHVGERVPRRTADLVGCCGDRLRAKPDAERPACALRLLRRVRRQPAGRPVHRPATGRRGRNEASPGRRAERLRRGRRSEWDSAHRLRRRLRHADLEIPRRLGEPAELDVRKQWPAELHDPGCPVRSSAMRLRLRRLRAPEGRPAGAGRARRPADVPACIPQLRRPRIARAQPHRDGRHA